MFLHSSRLPGDAFLGITVTSSLFHRAGHSVPFLTSLMMMHPGYRSGYDIDSSGEGVN